MTDPEFHTSENPKEQASEYITNVLKDHLIKGEKVLWLVPGGSAIAVAVMISKELQDFDCKNLTISLTDERYGEIGHNDSSWYQLEKAGFSVPGAQLYPVLQGKNIEETVGEYNNTLKNFIDEADFIIGLFGIGADGHTAGILPGSPAVESSDLAFGYQGGNYYRITVTPTIIPFIDEVVVYATGEEKKETLEKLKGDNTFLEQPAQCLKQAGKFIIFNN
jgi:6-phosphogluconolactonase/glucosamine-6-phosphate isomerase/deaminase